MPSELDYKAIVVFITVPNLDVGKQIARALVEGKLAACVNILSPIQSIYTWAEEIQEDEETLLIVKSRAELFEKDLIPAVQAIHPYEIPEIIALPVVSGLTSYLSWIGKTTGANSG